MRRAGVAVVQAQSGAVAGARMRRSSCDRHPTPATGARSGAARAGDLLRAGRPRGRRGDPATGAEMLRLAAVSGGETWDRLQRGALISEPRAGEDMLTQPLPWVGRRSGALLRLARRRRREGKRAAVRQARRPRNALTWNTRFAPRRWMRGAQQAKADRATGYARKPTESRRMGSARTRGQGKLRRNSKRATAKAKASSDAAAKSSRRG